MIYGYASIMEGVPFANGAPNLTVDTRALAELAVEKRVPIGGKDFKTGQTLMKTILAPGFKARMLGVSGWFSTNIRGAAGFARDERVDTALSESGGDPLDLCGLPYPLDSLEDDEQPAGVREFG